MLEQLTDPVILIVCGMFLGMVAWLGAESLIDYSIDKADIHGVTVDDLDPELVAEVNEYFRVEL